MNDLLSTLYSKLAASTSLTDYLSTYRGNPAIFTGGLAPRDADLPYVHIGMVVDEPHDTKTTRGREIITDVQIWFPDNGSVLDAHAAAETIRDLLHRGTFSISNYTFILSSTTITQLGPDDDAIGLNVELRLLMEKTS